MARRPMAGRRAILVRMSGKPVDGKVSRLDKNNIVMIQWLIARCKDREDKNYEESMVHYESKVEGRTLCGRLIGAKIAKRIKSNGLEQERKGCSHCIKLSKK